MSTAATQPELSIVVPALNEQDNVGPLVEQVDQTVRARGVQVELIVVDDGSTDATRATLGGLQADRPWLVVLHRDTPQGQSSAMHAGIQYARSPYIATLDADLQNDPADLVDMLAALKTQNADFVQGDRSANRQDNIIRRATSFIGRQARAWIVGDSTRDTGCSARVVKASFAKQFPLQFKGAHRFLPAYARILGATLIEMPVHHHPRVAGETKYGLGISKRGWSGLLDCFAFRWMKSRYRPSTTIAELIHE